MNQSFPIDVRLLEWGDRDDFSRIRAEWLQLHRWDTKLSSATVVTLAEVAARMAHDKNFAWPSIQRLAAELGWSEPTVKRAIAQAIQRGWIICEKRGFGASNHYAMAASPSITAEVIARHDQRISVVIEGRSSSMRSKMIPMESAPNEINSDPSMRSKMIPHSDQKRSLNEINSDPLTLSKNLITEPDHRTSTERLGETEHDESLGEPSVAILEIHRLLGEGDEALGASRASRLSGGRLAYLAEQIEEHGIVGAATYIQSAIRLAATLEGKANAEASP